MRAPEWGPGPVAANSISSAFYMFAYEFLFRGFLLFPCLAAMPAPWAIAINVALYALAHVPKGRREVSGIDSRSASWSAWRRSTTGSIWAAFLIHLVMSQLNDYLAVRANPEMRFAFKGLHSVNVLVTGATGYVGQRLAFRLAEGGATVHALCRSPDKAKALTHERIRVFFGDIEDRESLENGRGRVPAGLPRGGAGQRLGEGPRSLPPGQCRRHRQCPGNRSFPRH